MYAIDTKELRDAACQVQLRLEDLTRVKESRKWWNLAYENQNDLGESTRILIYTFAKTAHPEIVKRAAKEGLKATWSGQSILWVEDSISVNDQMAAVIKLPVPNLTAAAIKTLSDSPTWKGSAIQRLCKDLAERMKGGADDSGTSYTGMNKAEGPPDSIAFDVGPVGQRLKLVANKPDGSEVIVDEDGDGLVFEQKDALKMGGLGWPILLIRYDVEPTGSG